MKESASLRWCWILLNYVLIVFSNESWIDRYWLDTDSVLRDIYTTGNLFRWASVRTWLLKRGVNLKKAFLNVLVNLMGYLIKEGVYLRENEIYKPESKHTQLTFTCSKSTMKTWKKGVKYVQSEKYCKHHWFLDFE